MLFNHIHRKKKVKLEKDFREEAKKEVFAFCSYNTTSFGGAEWRFKEVYGFSPLSLVDFQRFIQFPDWGNHLHTMT